MGLSSKSNTETTSEPRIDLSSFLIGDTSQWHPDLVKQFCDLGFRSGLGFTKQQLEDVSLLPEAKVFGECSARIGDITAKKWSLDLAGVPESRKDLVEETVGAAFVQLRSAIAADERSEKKIDTLALQLGLLCGFNNGKPFRTTGEKFAFTFAGEAINNKADMCVLKRPKDTPADQLVLIWQNRLAGKTAVDEGVLHESAAQIIGETISIHWKNRSRGHQPRAVYAIRLIDDMVSFFRIEMSAEQIKAVCDDGVIPDPKLQVDYVPRNALKGGDEYGASLLHPDNRLRVVKMMACIRAEMERELPEPKSEAKRLKRSDL